MESPLRSFLEANGYRILERHHLWSECLILGHGEVWTGAGEDAETAFERAVKLCFPSTISRHALEAALAAPGLVGLAGAAANVDVPRLSGVAGDQAAPRSGVAEAQAGVTPISPPEPIVAADERRALESAHVAESVAAASAVGAIAGEAESFSAEPTSISAERVAAESVDAASAVGANARGVENFSSESTCVSAERVAAESVDAASAVGAIAGEAKNFSAESSCVSGESIAHGPIAAEAQRSGDEPAGTEASTSTAAVQPLAPSVEQARPSGRANLPTEEDRNAAFEELAARIEARRVEVSHSSPRRQRLVILGWLAEARSWQSDSSGYGIIGPVPTVVKTLRSLTECWWPGTIAAFQLHSTPANTRTRDLRGFVSTTPRTWREVAEAAEAAVRAVAAEESAAGWDDDGWADRSQTLPGPDAPEAMLKTIVSEVEAVGGPIDGPQPKGGELPTVRDLERWVRRLRWLRGSVPGDERWGLVAGRLRFWSQRTSEFTTASEYLDPGYRPPRSWASLFEAGEKRKQEASALENVIRSVPSAAAGERDLLAWLGEALPLTGAHQNTILQACAGLHEQILGVDEAQLDDADRRIRRRLQKLKAAIAGDDGPEEQELAPPVNEVALDDDASESEAVPDELLAITRGKRALFVGNRADTILQDRLVALLDLRRLEWSEATPRRVDAAVEAIASQTYDLVLGATGFMGHKYDGRLARACKGAGIPYVRADRGRPGAVVRALARDLGTTLAIAR